MASAGGAHVLDLAARETIAWTYTDGWLALVLMGRRRCPEIIEPPSISWQNWTRRRRTRPGLVSRAGSTHDWYDAVTRDFEQVCAILGITLSARRHSSHGGGSRQEPCIYFRGFWSGRRCLLRGRYAPSRRNRQRSAHLAPGYKGSTNSPTSCRLCRDAISTSFMQARHRGHLLPRVLHGNRGRTEVRSVRT